MSNKVDATDLNQEEKRELKPKLRFPEFRGAGEWEEKKIGALLVETLRPLQMRDEEEYSLVTVKRRYGGVVSRGTLKGKDIKVKSQFSVCNNDFLISKRQIVHNACGLVPKELEGSIVSNEYSVLTPRKNCDVVFSNYFSQQPKISESFLLSSVGIVIEKMLFKLDTWLGKKFLFPSFQEQQKIADCLSSIDDRITAETQKLDTLKAHKKGLMQQLFPAEGESLPKLRFPEFRDAGEWEEKTLGEVCGCIVPGRDKPKSFTGFIPWITIPDIQGLRIHSSVNRLGLSLDEIKECGAKIVPKNSVIMSCVGTFGLISICEQDLVINQQLHAWLPNLKINNYYLAYSLILQKNQMERMATNTTIAYLNKSSCNALIIPFTFLPEQQKIADCLSSLDELLTAQTQKIGTLKVHKKGLMQQLFPALDEVTG